MNFKNHLLGFRAFRRKTIVWDVLGKFSKFFWENSKKRIILAASQQNCKKRELIFRAFLQKVQFFWKFWENLENLQKVS